MMAKGKTSFENMGAGLFGKAPENDKTDVPEQSEKNQTNSERGEEEKKESKSIQTTTVKKRKAGKPKDSDLQESEDTIPTIVQLTKTTKYAIDKYTLEKGYKSRSQAIRELIRKI